jgi:hypothetical protein
LSAIEHSDGSESSLRNDFIAGLNAGNLPITDLGVLFARNPAGLYAAGVPQGVGQTHLFFQSDIDLGLPPGGGGIYQITPIHKNAKTDPIPWAAGAPTVLPFGTPSPGGLLFKPLASEENGVTALMTIEVYDATNVHIGNLQEGVHYAVNAGDVTINDPASLPAPYPTATIVVITYTHAGHV